MVFQNDILAGAAGAGDGGYTINQSIRFPSPTTGYLNRTPSSASDRRTWTWSGWIKRSTLATLSGSADAVIFGADASSSNFLHLRIDGASTNADQLYLVASSSTMAIRYAPLLRDVSAWYHIVVRIDTTDATAADRAKLYLNGTQITDIVSSTYPSLNREFAVNNTVEHDLGRLSYAGTETFEGYMAEINFVDGTALDATSFGEYNDDGVWVPKKYTGAYGTNGWYLTGATAADLGEDFSGNGNDWTSTGLDTDDQRGDTPTANHATWNPLFFRRTGSYKPTFADGNLYVAGKSSQVSHTGTTISSSGKHYAEFLLGGTSSITGPGVIRSYWDGGLAESYASNFGGSYYGSNGTRKYNATSDVQTAPGANRVGIEVDFANNEVEYFIVTSGGTKTSQGGKLTSSDGIAFDGEGIFTATLHDTSSRNITAFFEEADWWGTPNTGYKALSTANLPGPAIADGSKYFQTSLYTGTGSTLEVNQSENSTFQPDFVWIKKRSGAERHELEDAVRGASLRLSSDRKDAEDTGGLTSFDVDGFTVDGLYGSSGESGFTYAAWQWLAGNGTASNTDGTITSTVSANVDAGFSVIGYTGNETSGATIGHGLGVAPAMVITKSRSSGSYHWYVYHQSNGATKYMRLNDNSAVFTDSAAWNNTAPTSSVITLGNSSATNNTGTMIAYAFAEVEGFSKFGSYEGNGSTNGPCIFTGFRPAFVLVKEYTSADDWLIYDSSRDPYNVAGRVLRPDDTAAEFDGRGGSRDVDFLSNGFKFRSSNGTMNGNGVGYIFMAFAEHPFGGDGVAPVPAR